MNKVPISVPVYIERFEENETADRFTKAKLKVFYVGETADHRLFTKEFSDKVKESLPLTPVVGYYSEESDDFVGHNKTQYIYGVVPDGAAISYEEDDDNHHTYLVTDIILYTEREDNIGKVASKIIGKQHSLELNPNTLKYKINRDANGRFKNVEFIDGQFIGLSVLGDKETPAFTGSGFFALSPNIDSIAENCKDRFNQFIDILNHNGGSIEVFDSENYFNKVQAKFAEISMQDFIQKIYQALENIGIYGYLVENTENHAIVSSWSDAEKKIVYTKYEISLQDDTIVLGDSEEVFVRYLTSDEIDAIDNNATATANSIDSSDDEGTANGDMSADGDANGDSSDEENNDGQEGANDAPLSDKDEKDEKEGQMGTATASVSSAALTDSERAELENYRRQEKIAKINEYRNELSDELLDKYIAECDNFTASEIEAKLAIEYRKFSKNHPKDDSSKQIMAFSVITKGEEGYDETDSAQVINKYAKKK